jgi:diamine N-acetyltransferase
MGPASAPEVALRPVTRETWEACTALEVTDEQRRFVSPVARYLAFCAHGGEWAPLAIHSGPDVVGFAMWAVDDEDGSAWVGGLVIDRSRQRQGYGRAAMERLIAMLAGTGARQIGLSYERENLAAKRLYASLGFRETGELVEGEVVARLDVTS